MHLTPNLDEPRKKTLDNMPSKIDIGDKTKFMKQHLKYIDILRYKSETWDFISNFFCYVLIPINFLQ